MSFRKTYSPQSPWEGLQATNFDQYLHIVMFSEKCTDVSEVFFWLGVGRVEERGLCGGNFPWRNLSWGKRISMKGYLIQKRSEIKFKK